ncbi:MAG: hypothetical protein Q9157_003334 [Trypethelium eluteriae]
MLAPSSAFNHNQIRIPPPIYTTDRNFRFDLSCLMNEDNAMTLAIREQFDLDRFRQSTSLDYAQASAVVDALTRSVALIQGPPGTGKGFTGVALIKVLLENAKSGDIGPVICVCYTNHALDQLLEQLLAHGIEQIIRIGSQSKSELLQPLNLWTVMKMVDRTQMERGIRAELAKKLTRDTEYIQSLLEELGRAGSVISIEEYLKVNYPNQYRQLFSDEDEEGFTFVYRKENAIDDWLHARHPKTTDLGESAGVTRPLAELLTADVHDMSMTERDILYRYWTSGIVDDLRDQLTTSLLDYRVTSKEHEHVQDDLKLRCLKQAKIIGLTTTGLAKNVSLFRRLRSKVLICEEADEVLEAHLFTALLPSIEQAIFIGDPQQLRPQIQNYELSRENYEGEKYSLDLSLFERLIQPQESWPGLPYSVLQTQRRMHPGISHLIRETLYPQLEDAETVVDYPEVPGIRKRLYWLDHSHLESGEDEKSTSSHSNDFEVEMVTALVSHLTRQSVYQPNDIAVLTPYLGQLHKLRQSLMCRCEIVVNDRDAQDLDAPGLEEPLVQQRSETARTTLLNAVRIATVDNFQGEEAKVVVISLVRSNAQNRCGFLKTSNRINVLLSRAKHGMYIIGNSLTYEGVQMWNDMLRMLRESRNVGPELELQCSRHPETLMNVSIPDDFLRLAPEGPSVCGEQCPDAKYCHVCASDDIRETQVDYIEGKTYNDIDPAQDPVIFPQCGHFITVSNMDGQMDMARHYTMAADGSPNGLRGESEPLSDSNLGVKSCPQCRSSLRNVSRYGRIVRRALLDEATKKFIIAASRDYVPLAKRLLDIQGELQSTTAEQQQTFVLARTEKVKLEGSPAYQAQTIAKKSRKSTRYKPTLTLRRTVQKHLDSVRVQEQPFRRVWDMVQTARRLHSTAQGSFKFSSSVLHTTSELRATALLFRCDITLLSDFVKQQQQLASGEMQGELSINLVRNRRDSLVMIETAESAGDILRQMEGHFFFASFVAIERMVRGEETGDLKERALEHIKTAEALPDNSDAGYIQGVLVELEEVKRALNEGIFYSVVQNEEWRAVVSATSQEFSTTGHWYRCLNGHPFAIGECGRPMENTRCPECGAPVDGQHHQAAEGVEQMHGLEQEFSVMGIE